MLPVANTDSFISTMKMCDKKEILFIHHDQGNSGSSRSLSFLLDEINTEKFDLKLHCIFYNHIPSLLKKKHVELVPGRGIHPFHSSTGTGVSFTTFRRNVLRLPQSLVFAYKLIKKQKPDIVHLNSSCLFMVAFASKLVSRKIKVVCHVREPLLRHSLSAAFARYMNYLFVDHFIAIDSFTGSRLKTKNNIDIIYNTVNFEDYNPCISSNVLREELGIKENEVIFLYLARMAKCNGAIELIHAANKITETHPDFHFVLVGLEDSSDKYSKQVITDAAQNSNIHLLRFRNDIPLVIADADILVVPFTQPHFARAIVEASSMGKPSIGVNIGGVNELIRHNETGFLYNNTDEFYNYCIELGTDKALRKKMGESAAGFAKANFDNKTSSKKVMHIYDTLLKEK